MTPDNPLLMLRRRIEAQGFRLSDMTDVEVRALDPWLRMTPFLTGLIAALSTLMASPYILGALAVVLAFAVVLPRHPFDIAYNRFIRALENSPAIPPTPPRRRIVYAILCAMLWGSAACFALGSHRWGATFGWAVAMEMGVVAAHQLCVISEALVRMRTVSRAQG
jgi:hypothetical protein